MAATRSIAFNGTNMQIASTTQLARTGQVKAPERPSVFFTEACETSVRIYGRFPEFRAGVRARDESRRTRHRPHTSASQIYWQRDFLSARVCVQQLTRDRHYPTLLGPAPTHGQ
jgi:hypothetical protein